MNQREIFRLKIIAVIQSDVAIYQGTPLNGISIKIIKYVIPERTKDNKNMNGRSSRKKGKKWLKND